MAAAMAGGKGRKKVSASCTGGSRKGKADEAARVPQFLVLKMLRPTMSV